MKPQARQPVAAPAWQSRVVRQTFTLGAGTAVGQAVLLWFLVIVSTLPFLTLLLFAPAIFARVFGPQWEAAGEFCQITCLMHFLAFVTQPLSNVVYIAEKQKADLWIQIGLVLPLVCSFYLTSKISPHPTVVIGTFAAAYFAKHVLQLVMSYWLSKGTRPKSVARSRVS